MEIVNKIKKEPIGTLGLIISIIGLILLWQQNAIITDLNKPYIGLTREIDCPSTFKPGVFNPDTEYFSFFLNNLSETPATPIAELTFDGNGQIAFDKELNLPPMKELKWSESLKTVQPYALSSKTRPSLYVFYIKTNYEINARQNFSFTLKIICSECKNPPIEKTCKYQRNESKEESKNEKYYELVENAY
jgi:hypothetical protein